MIGRGWAGAVYRAEHSMMGRPTALKIITSPLASEPAFLERFRQAAKFISDIESPYVAMVHDLGIEPPNRVFVASELIEGMSLARILVEEGPLSAQRVLDIVRLVIEGLKTIHQMGAVHGCIKPTNILIPRDSDNPRIVDFAGLRIMTALGDRSFATVTSFGTVFGEIAYLAPEQITAGQADVRTDVYALGLTMYELLTGGKPFRHESLAELAKAHVQEKPVGPRDFKPQLKIPKFIEKAVMQALEKDPAKRQQSAGMFAEQLQAEIVPEEQPTRPVEKPKDRPVILMPAQAILQKEFELLRADEKPPEARAPHATVVAAGPSRPGVTAKSAAEPPKPEEPSGPRLVLYDGKKVKSVFPVNKSEMLVGRSPDCDIMIDDGSVSRRHARITSRPGRFVVENLKSLNGTYINDEAVERGHIEDNDSVAFGSVVLVFRTT
jgi:serine/threonine-protein kinase